MKHTLTTLLLMPLAAIYGAGAQEVIAITRRGQADDTNAQAKPWFKQRQVHSPTGTFG